MKSNIVYPELSYQVMVRFVAVAFMRLTDPHLLERATIIRVIR